MTPLHFRTPLRDTPFHARTGPLNLLHRWGAWAGCRTALCYGDTAMEYTAIRNAATLYDLSPMIKYRITGPEADAFLNRLTLRNAARLVVGAAQYTAWTDDAGHVLDDGTLFRLGPDDYLLTCQERHLPWLLDSAAGFAATVTDATDDMAALALQGPCSAWVLRQAGAEVEGLRPFRVTAAQVGGVPVTLSRTGFTGDLGYELWCAPADALALWDALMAAGRLRGIRPAGSDALNLARLEAGFLIANQDFVPAHQALREDRARTPFDLGLDWLIDWDKGPFTGRRALAAVRARGSDWAMVGLDIEGNVPAEGALIYQDKRREVGHVTAAAWSPATKRNIALAQIRRPYAQGRDLWAEVYAPRELQYVRLMLRATPCARPFFAPDRRRATPPGDW